MLASTEANKLTNAINVAFTAIGNTTGAAMPPAKSNREHIAWEFHVASHLYRVAEGRRKVAHKAAVKAGLLFDHEKAPLAEGTTAVLFTGDNLQLGVNVKAASIRVDTTALVTDLLDAGVDEELIMRLLKKHTHTNRAPHTFTSSFILG